MLAGCSRSDETQPRLLASLRGTAGRPRCLLYSSIIGGKGVNVLIPHSQYFQKRVAFFKTIPRTRYRKCRLKFPQKCMVDREPARAVHSFVMWRVQ